MHQSEQTSRRDFMKTAAATGGALFLGFNWFTASATPKVVDAAKIAAGGIDPEIVISCRYFRNRL